MKRTLDNSFQWKHSRNGVEEEGRRIRFLLMLPLGCSKQGPRPAARQLLLLMTESSATSRWAAAVKEEQEQELTVIGGHVQWPSVDETVALAQFPGQ